MDCENNIVEFCGFEKRGKMFSFNDKEFIGSFE